MNDYSDANSQKAGAVISYLTRMRYLSPPEKALLLKGCLHQDLLTRLLLLAFKKNIIRLDVDSICEKKTLRLRNADQRLLTFIRVNEDFFSDEISFSTARQKLAKVMHKLHPREFAFYDNFLKGGTGYLDFTTFRKALLKGTKVNSIQFMRARLAAPNHAWGGKRYIVQPNYQGLQLKLILELDKRPRLIGGDGTNYASRMRNTLDFAQDFLEEKGVDRLEFDAILIPRDKQARPVPSWKAKGHQLFIYDVVNGRTLKQRLKTVHKFCEFMKENGNVRIHEMPSQLVTGPNVRAEALAFNRPTNPFVTRHGVVVKEWDSLYEYKRSSKWLTFLPITEAQKVAFVERGTLVALGHNHDKVVVQDNNGVEVDVMVSKACYKYLDRYLGYTIEYAHIHGYPSFRSVLYMKGREV